MRWNMMERLAYRRRTITTLRLADGVDALAEEKQGTIY